MNYNYTQINNEFLDKVSPFAKEKLKSDVHNGYISTLKNKERALSIDEYFNKINYCKAKFVIGYCAYCKRLMSMRFLNMKGKSVKNAKYCVFCGNSNIYEMANIGLKRVEAMIKISKQLTNSEEVNLINQQILTMIATKIEFYFREFYKTYLNITIVKNGVSRIDKFEKECKNDFINIGKTYDRFRKELNIDLREIISIDDKNHLKDLFEYRNVIVHNNGIVDKKFINNTTVKIENGKSVNISYDMLQNYLSAVKRTVDLTGKIYEAIFEKELIDEINRFYEKKVLEEYKQG